MGKNLKVGIMVLMVAVVFAAAPALAQDKLVIWWNKSFVPQQDEAFKEIVQKWEKKTGKQADLSFFALPDHPAKMLAAFDSKIVPDVDFGQIVAVQNDTFAYEDKLLEISDVLNPIRGRFTEGSLLATEYLNGKTGKRGTYTFPLMQHGVNIHYWLDMLQAAGFKESDIPKQWKPFWDFWGEVQKRLRAKGERVHGLGITYSVEATDTWQEFDHFMEAHHVRVMDDNGKLLVDDPKVRQGINHRPGRFYPPLQSQECSPRGHQLEGHRQQRELQQPAGGDDHEPHPFHSRFLLRERTTITTTTRSKPCAGPRPRTEEALHPASLGSHRIHSQGFQEQRTGQGLRPLPPGTGKPGSFREGFERGLLSRPEGILTRIRFLSRRTRTGRRRIRISRRSRTVPTIR